MIQRQVPPPLGHLVVEAIPQPWLDQLDLKDVVDTVTTDLFRSTYDRDALSPDGIYDPERYPGVEQGGTFVVWISTMKIHHEMFEFHGNISL